MGKAFGTVPADLLSVTEAAERIGYSRQWLAVRTHIAEGPQVTWWRRDESSNQWRALYRPEDLDAWKASGKPVNEPSDAPNRHGGSRPGPKPASARLALVQPGDTACSQTSDPLRVVVLSFLPDIKRLEALHPNLAGYYVFREIIRILESTDK